MVAEQLVSLQQQYENVFLLPSSLPDSIVQIPVNVILQHITQSMYQQLICINSIQKYTVQHKVLLSPLSRSLWGSHSASSMASFSTEEAAEYFPSVLSLCPLSKSSTKRRVYNHFNFSICISIEIYTFTYQLQNLQFGS